MEMLISIFKQSIFVLLKGAAEIGDDFFVDVLTDMCKLAGVSDIFTANSDESRLT